MKNKYIVIEKNVDELQVGLVWSKHHYRDGFYGLQYKMKQLGCFIHSKCWKKVNVLHSGLVNGVHIHTIGYTQVYIPYFYTYMWCAYLLDK